MNEKKIKVEQVEFGMQKKRYGDHVYKWYIETEGLVSVNDIIDYMQYNYSVARNAMCRDFYNKDRRSDDYDRCMKAIVRGYYTISMTSNDHYTFTVTQEYID